MDWVYTKRRRPEWKQGWKDQTMTAISTPPPPSLLLVFGTVIILLWISHFTGFKAQLHQAAASFQLFLILLPILFIFIFIASCSNNGGGFSGYQLGQQYQCKGIPWAITIFVVVLLVTVYNQSK